MARNALDKKQMAEIRSLVKDERWGSLLAYLEIRLQHWRAEPTTGTNEFETLRALFSKDGKIEGLLEFFNDVELQAFKDE